MQMTTEARTWLDSTVRRILARHPLGDAERTGITYELMSHLHAAGEARATAAGRSEVAREDLAAAFVEPLAKPVERVLFGRRLGAYVIDMIIVFIGIGLIQQLLDFVPGAHLFFEVAPAPPLWRINSLWYPWGQDPTLSYGLQALFALASGAWVIGYFAWTEAHGGRSLGKRALKLQVMRVDGGPITFRESILRNLVKLSPPLLFLDVVIMLLAFAKDKQRVSDRIAGTIVVKA